MTLSRGGAEARGGEHLQDEQCEILGEITEAIIDAAIQIHRDLGPGLLESVYEAVLVRVVNDLPPSAAPRLRVNQSA